MNQTGTFRASTRVLVINPGSTSTKLALYDNGKPTWMAGAHHPVKELNQFHSAAEQYEYRMDFIRKKLSESGIDVSEHDGEIDWTQVKAAGVDFAMLRLGFRGYGQGTMNLDKYFLANLSGASAAGIKVGVYFFSQAITEDEAREEADYVINSLAATDVELSYPIVFDEEPITDGNVARTDDLTAAQFSANALAFCQRVEQAGYTPMLYGNKHELAKLDLKGELAGYDVWYAEYGVSQPTGKFDFVMWQYSDTGSIPGVVTSAGQVDLNIRFLVA